MRRLRTLRSPMLGVALPLLLAGLVGCRSTPTYVDNPATMPTGDYELVWQRTIESVERYFDVAYENRYDGRIETAPQVGATLAEPWRPDTIGLDQRLESTLQTIRRRGFLLIQPAPRGGFEVTCEVYKELEDVPRPVFALFTAGSFIPSVQPIRREVGDSPVDPGRGWISQGRDTALERRILADIQKSLDADGLGGTAFALR